MVLGAQLHDWHKFRAFQSRAQRRHRNGTSNEVENRACESRSSYGPGSNIHSGSTPGRQIWLEDWGQFQGYQLHRLERLRAKLDELEEELKEARKGRSGNRSDQVEEDVSPDVDVVPYLVEVAQQDLERHQSLLRWIEQERQTMLHSDVEPHGRDNQDALLDVMRRRGRHSTCRPRHSVCTQILGKPKVRKATPKRRHNPKRDLETNGPEPGAQDWATDSRRCASGVSKHRGVKSPEIKTTRIGGVPRRRMHKTQLPTDISASSSSGQQCWDITQTRPLRHGPVGISQVLRPPSQPRSTRKSATTRSGRISRPPIRWRPG